MTHLISLVVVIVHVQGWLRAKAKQASSRCGGAEPAWPSHWNGRGRAFAFRPSRHLSVPSLAETISDVSFKVNDWPHMMSMTRNTNNDPKIEVSNILSKLFRSKPNLTVSAKKKTAFMRPPRRATRVRLCDEKNVKCLQRLTLHYEPPTDKIIGICSKFLFR